MSLQIIEKGLWQVERALLILSGALLIGLMLLGAADVLGRYLFDYPILGTQEISEILMAGVVLLGWAYTYKTGRHVKVDLFTAHYPTRLRLILEMIMTILSLGLFVIITQQSTISAMQYWQEGRFLPTLKIPSYPFYFIVPVGAALLCLELIIRLTQISFSLKRSE